MKLRAEIRVETIHLVEIEVGDYIPNNYEHLVMGKFQSGEANTLNKYTRSELISTQFRPELLP